MNPAGELNSKVRRGRTERWGAGTRATRAFGPGRALPGKPGRQGSAGTPVTGGVPSASARGYGEDGKLLGRPSGRHDVLGRRVVEDTIDHLRLGDYGQHPSVPGP